MPTISFSKYLMVIGYVSIKICGVVITNYAYHSIIKQVAHCDHGMIAHWQRNRGSLATDRRPIWAADYSLIFCTSVVISSFFISALLFFNVLLSYLYIRHAGSGKSFIFFKNFKKIFLRFEYPVYVLSLF